MELQLYQVDAFTNKAFGGNFAAVCPLAVWLPDQVLQNIAAENNLPETAFFVPEGSGYHLRWFTPTSEVRLCGHATLASAFVICNFVNPSLSRIGFESLSGPLHVTRHDDRYMLDFPVWKLRREKVPPILTQALGATPDEFYVSDDAVAVFKDAATIQSLKPDMGLLAQYDGARGVIVTAPGTDGIDFVSRAFYPRIGIPEDPATGSAHCALTPYWAEKLNKMELQARQISKRTGELSCRLNGARVEITGQARLYLKGTIYI